MSSSRGRSAGKEGGDGSGDSLNEYEWVAAAKTASFSLGDDSNSNSRSPNKNAKKGASSIASSAAGSAMSEVSCDALSIMEWATDILSTGENNNNNNAQDGFAENTLSPLRHRKIPTPSRVRSKRQGNYPAAEQRLPKNDLPGHLATGFPNWEGTTITADARKSDAVSVLTPLGGETALRRNNPTASEPSNFGNWDQFEKSKWDSCPDLSSHFSESEEGLDVIYKKQPKRQPKNKRKLIWVVSIAVFLIVIIAIAVPLSKNSKNGSETNGNENIFTELENNVTTIVPDSTPSQPALSPEREPALTEDQGYINGQSTIVPAESNPSPPQSEPSLANDPVLESKPAPSEPVLENEPITPPVSAVSEPSPSAPAPAQNNDSVGDKPAPSEPVLENEPITPPVSAVSEPSPSEPVLENEPISSPVSNVELELQSIQEEPPNSEPVESSESQQVQTPAQPLSPANSQPDTVLTPPPTSNPTRLPTSPPTPSCIQVRIQADKFAQETSWVLKNVDRNEEVGSVPEDTYAANEVATHDFCGLESGKYTFTIRDKYGDGMCCGNGRGKYRVFINNRQIIYGGNFKKELSFDILIGYDPGTLTEREYQYWVGHNNRRKAFHEKHGTEYVPLAWSTSLAERARAWAMTLLAECDDPTIRHDPNRGGDGENLAKNRGNNPNAGLGQLYPVESIVSRWVEREMNWDWPENAHLTQALWRGSSYLGCADVEETKEGGSICRVQVCRYRRSGNCNMGSFGADWLTATLQDESACGEVCPEEGCYIVQ